MPRSTKTKGDIDKETMYKKIMPTSLRPTSDIPAPDRHESVYEILREQPGKAAPPEQEGVSISKNAKTMVLINLMEHLVVERLDGAFSKFKCCRCDKCKKDVAALALNKLPPKYVVTEPDKVSGLQAYLEGQEVSTAIVQAIIQVRANPRH